MSNFAILPQFLTNFEHFVFAKDPGFFAFFFRYFFAWSGKGFWGGGLGWGLGGGFGGGGHNNVMCLRVMIR